MIRGTSGRCLKRGWVPATFLIALSCLLPGLALGEVPVSQAQATVHVNLWSRYHYDLANTGFNSHETILSPSTVESLTVKWTFAMGNLVISSPAIVDGVVYSGDESGYVYAIDAASGTQRWSHLVGGIPNDLTFANSVVFVGTTVGHELFALDATTGQERWSFQSLWPVEAPTVIGNTLYVATSVGELYAFRTSDGTQRWKTTFNGEPFDDLAYS